MAQAAVPGRPKNMSPAKMRSMRPLTNSKLQRAEKPRLWVKANMIEATPSSERKIVRMRVSEIAPDSGQRSSTTPAAIPNRAENSDHQNPGALRMLKVLIRPTIPLTSNTQPMTISTARVAMGGSRIAAIPRISRHDAFG